MEIVGATVWFQSEERLALLTEDGFILWAHFEDSASKQFKANSNREGTPVWVYYIKALMTTARSIVSIVLTGPGSEKREDLPVLNPIEIDK